MNTQHREIFNALKRIPQLHKEFINLEKSITGTDEKKRTLSKENYDLLILNFDDKNSRGTGLKRRLVQSGEMLYSAKPDFVLSLTSKTKAERYIGLLAKDAVSDRMKNQLELFNLLEMKKKFTNINDFLNEDNIKELNKYLKGKI